ncbi:MAG: pyrroloquinoline quinone-dependent dehydrogenase, partial [Chitinophagaceae bacterium]|nr:pyrroloquinoline quinone-dependent dehydrogenase [Chitinophagaceae bacterium]
MPGFGHLNDQEKKAIASFILNLTAEQKEIYADTLKEEADGSETNYTFTGYNKFLTKEGYPAISPPWGTLTAVDLSTGLHKWQIPFGEYEEFKSKGIPPTGRENYGGPVVTAGGLIFIGASDDAKFRAIHVRNGEILYETDLPATGFATPAVYSVKGRQYVVIAAGGSKWGGKKSDAYVAFALPGEK